MNPRHYTQSHKYQQMPMMYSQANYSQSHTSNKFNMNDVYNKSYIKATMRSPQHPNNKMEQLRLDDATMRSSAIYEQQQQQQATASNHLKPKYQQKIQIGSSNNNYYGTDSSLNDLRILQNLEMRRQEILQKLKQYENFKHAAQQTVNGNGKYISCCYASRKRDFLKKKFNITAHPNHHVKNDLINDYWNTTMNTNDNLQQSQTTNNSRSPVDLGYVTNQTNNTELGRDMFVRSDSILTDDDYVPFEAPAQSKFGPISRMSTKQTSYPTNHMEEALANQSFFNGSSNNMRLPMENMHRPNVVPTTTTAGSVAAAAAAASTTSNDASVWLYNNLQKSPNYNYQTDDLTPIKSIYQQSTGISPDALALNDDGKCKY